MKIDKESAILGWVGYGSMLWVPQERYNDELEVRIAVILVVISWVTLCVLPLSKRAYSIIDYWEFTQGWYYIWIIVATFGAILSLARIT